jgi:hypothetical protein
VLGAHTVPTSSSTVTGTVWTTRHITVRCRTPSAATGQPAGDDTIGWCCCCCY